MNQPYQFINFANHEIRVLSGTNETLFVANDVCRALGIPQSSCNYYLNLHVPIDYKEKMTAPTKSGIREIWFISPEGLNILCRAFPKQGLLLLDALNALIQEELPDHGEDDLDEMDELIGELDELESQYDSLKEENAELQNKLSKEKTNLDYALRALGVSVLMGTPYELLD